MMLVQFCNSVIYLQISVLHISCVCGGVCVCVCVRVSTVKTSKGPSFSSERGVTKKLGSQNLFMKSRRSQK